LFNSNDLSRALNYSRADDCAPASFSVAAFAPPSGFVFFAAGDSAGLGAGIAPPPELPPHPMALPKQTTIKQITDTRYFIINTPGISKFDYPLLLKCSDLTVTHTTENKPQP
jgi:hypothetical protein